jgi:hypothetical protein
MVIAIHRGWGPIVGIFVFLGAVETIAVHLLVAWWPLTVLSLASVAWLVADAIALRVSSIVVEDDRLVVGVGLRWHVIVPRDAIAAVERVSTVPAGAVDLKVLDPAVLITLRAPVTVRGLFGRRRRGDRIVVSADEPEKLVSALAA